MRQAGGESMGILEISESMMRKPEEPDNSYDLVTARLRTLGRVRSDFLRWLIGPISQWKGWTD